MQRPANVVLRRTKFHRPGVAVDLVRREHLTEYLQRGIELPLTLVCAPAGYGKSTLLADWLRQARVPSAWLSLDQQDNEPVVFLSYLVAAVRGCFPQACESTWDLLQSNDVPELSVLGLCLGNDLDAIDQRLVLVLDDYHCIRSPAIHDLLDRVLLHPPRSLHLALASRRDPPLSIGLLRARGRLHELGVRDLSFSRGNVETFLRSAANRDLGPDAIDLLQRNIEGWPAGFRLLALAIRSHPEPNRFVRVFNSSALKAEDYLAQEVLAAQSPVVRNWLRTTSILDRFCPSLCEALCHDHDDDAEPDELSGQGFVSLIQTAGLFAVPLDDSGDWCRYHHLFQSLLQGQLEDKVGGERVALLHARAGQWFDSEGLIEEAQTHYLAAGAAERAADVIVRNSQLLMDSEQWTRIDRCLSCLPEAVLQANVDLLILRARLLDKQGRYGEWEELLTQIQEQLVGESLDGPDSRRRRGEVDVMLAAFSYHYGNGADALARAETALESLPENCANQRVYAVLLLTASQQMVGDLPGARRVISDAMETLAPASPTVRGRLLQAQSFTAWIAGDLHALRRSAAAMLKVGQTESLPETKMYAQYFRGAAAYQQGDLAEAERAVVGVARNQFGPSFFMHLMSVQCLALVRLASGDGDESRALSSSLLQHMLESGKTSLLPQAQALQAILDLRLGRKEEAFRWASELPISDTPAGGYHFLVPELVAARVLVAAGASESFGRTALILDALSSHFRSTHNRRFLIETLAVQSLLRASQGRAKTAADLLSEAISFSRPGGFIQLYVDLGPDLVAVLSGLKLDDAGIRYRARILAGFEASRSPVAETSTSGSEQFWTRPPGESLTPREAQVLACLQQRLSNGEIAESLFISAKTVRRHTENIYSKLGVHSRREAVAKAKGLGLL